MKKLLLLTLVSTCALTTFSQIRKAQWLLGGNVSFSSSKYGKDPDQFRSKTTTFEISPDIGYFIINKLAAGGRVSFSSSKTALYYTYDEDYNSSSLGLSPFVRYYFLNTSKKINVFADGSYTYTTTKIKNKSTNPNSQASTTKTQANGFSFAAGPVFFLTPNTALELTLDYNYSKYKSDTEPTNTFMAGIGLQIHLGKGKKK